MSGRPTAQFAGELDPLGFATCAACEAARSRRRAAERAATLAAAASAVGDARGSAVLGLISQRLPPELRARVLAFHPSAAALPREPPC